MTNKVQSQLDQFFAQSSKLYSFQKEHILISPADEKISYIYYLKSGYVKQTFTNREGNEMLLNIYKPASYFPMMLYMANMDNKYTFAAMTNIEVYKSEPNELFNFIKSNTELLLDLSKRYAKGLNGLLLKIETLMFTDAYHRLALLLIYLAGEYGRKAENGTVINLYFTHEDLASWLGIQRETVSKQFEILEGRGIIEYLDKLIFIKDLRKLTKIIE